MNNLWCSLSKYNNTQYLSGLQDQYDVSSLNARVRAGCACIFYNFVCLITLFVVHYGFDKKTFYLYVLGLNCTPVASC